MKPIYFLSICALTFFFSCSNNEPLKHPIQKKWELEKVTRGLDSQILYNEGLVIWTFSQTELVVENAITSLGPEQLNSGFVTGTYSYEIKVENGVETLFVNNEKEGKITINNNQLIIDYGVSSDGPAKFFKQ